MTEERERQTIINSMDRIRRKGVWQGVILGVAFTLLALLSVSALSGQPGLTTLDKRIIIIPHVVVDQTFQTNNTGFDTRVLVSASNEEINYQIKLYSNRGEIIWEDGKTLNPYETVSMRVKDKLPIIEGTIIRENTFDGFVSVESEQRMYVNAWFEQAVPGRPLFITSIPAKELEVAPIGIIEFPFDTTEDKQLGIVLFGVQPANIRIQVLGTQLNPLTGIEDGVVLRGDTIFASISSTFDRAGNPIPDTVRNPRIVRLLSDVLPRTVGWRGVIRLITPPGNFYSVVAITSYPEGAFTTEPVSFVRSFN